MEVKKLNYPLEALLAEEEDKIKGFSGLSLET